MLTEKQMHRYAEVLFWGLKTARKEPFRKNDNILIRYEWAALKMAEIVQVKLLKWGLNPILRLEQTPVMERNFLLNGNDRQLRFIAPGERELFQNLQGLMVLKAPESLTHLSDMDPLKISKPLIARKPLGEILDHREEKGLFGWTLCLLPTPALAKHSGLSLRQYTNQIIRACYLDEKDPVQVWQNIHDQALKVKKWLNRMEILSLRIVSKNMDLIVTPGKDRRWTGVSGHNIPSFEIFFSPDWRGTEGVYYADQPSFRSGNLVEKVRLIFKKGAVREVRARKGADFIEKQIRMDKGSRRVGEFSLTDKRFSRINCFMASTLFDENYGGRNGNCHLALGSSYPTYAGDLRQLTKAKKEKLGFNDSALHWDLVNTEEKTVFAHLKNNKVVLIYSRGMFQMGL
jgi:aminopeptidase